MYKERLLKVIFQLSIRCFIHFKDKVYKLLIFLRFGIFFFKISNSHYWSDTFWNYFLILKMTFLLRLIVSFHFHYWYSLRNYIFICYKWWTALFVVYSAKVYSIWFHVWDDVMMKIIIHIIVKNNTGNSVKVCFIQIYKLTFLDYKQTCVNRVETMFGAYKQNKYTGAV